MTAPSASYDYFLCFYFLCWKLVIIAASFFLFTPWTLHSETCFRHQTIFMHLYSEGSGLCIFILGTILWLCGTAMYKHTKSDTWVWVPLTLQLPTHSTWALVMLYEMFQFQKCITQACTKAGISIHTIYATRIMPDFTLTWNKIFFDAESISIREGSFNTAHSPVSELQYHIYHV